MNYRFFIGKTTLISLGLFIHCFVSCFLLGLFYLSYGISHSCGNDGYTPYLVLCVIISLINVLPIIALSAKYLLPKISTIVSLVSNSIFCTLDLYGILSAYNFALDIDLDNLPFLIIIIATYAIVIFGSVLAMIIRYRKSK